MGPAVGCPDPRPSAARLAVERPSVCCGPGIAVDSRDVIEVLDWLEAVGIAVWVDGGWGVDALVREETRDHADLDLALDSSQLDLARRALEKRGFLHDGSREPGLPARLVMRDGRGREVDLHPLAFDAAGDGWQQLAASGWHGASTPPTT